MSLFKRKNVKEYNQNEICCPVKGNVIDITDTNDPVFSELSMGDGIGIIPEDNLILSPVSGEVCMVFPTSHAFGLRMENGIEILIHIGIDTVNLNGEGFKSYVKQGDKIKMGDKLVHIDLDLIKKEGYDPTIMLILTKALDKKIYKNYGEHQSNDVIIELK